MCCYKMYFLLAFLVFIFFRMKVLMIFFQQDEYRNNWFLKLIFGKYKLVDKKLSLSILVVLILSLLFKNEYISYAVFLIALLFGIYEHRVLKFAKKPLVITQRVKRIFGVAFVLAILEALALVKINSLVAFIILIQLAPFDLIMSNILLQPYENKTQKGFLDEAKENLKKCNPIVIGITGSYGKTSTKHILAHILSGNLPVLFTPGSVNTEMGVCRIAREKLQPQHKFFIVEMGAYFRGSIKKLCDFVNPKHGIITAVGQTHYEHFKTQETIAATKFELGECVQKNNGQLIINTNQIEERFVPKDMNLIKVGDGNNIFISDIKQTNDGLSLKYHKDGNSYDVFAPIYGEHHAQNIALAITLALQLGMDIDTVISMLKTLPQINHRLEVKRQPNDVIIVDDAYNSNIKGFKSGLDLLQKLDVKRRILITPGMVELGAKHDEQHEEVGKYAGTRVDVAIVILPKRIPTFIKGFNETKKEGTQLITMNSFSEAQKWMQDNLKAGDIVLLENDLPDVYENQFRL